MLELITAFLLLYIVQQENALGFVLRILASMLAVILCTIGAALWYLKMKGYLL